MKHLITLFALVFTLSAAQAQQFPFDFTVETGQSYQDLNDPTSLTEGEIWDDPQLTLPLGFDFEFLGTVVNTLYIEDWFLGGVLATDNSESGASPVLFAYGSDLIDRGDVSGLPQSPISYQVDGNPGSRIFKLEWKNAGFYNEASELGTTNDFVNIQLWIYEGSNDFELRFGPSSIVNDSIAHEGFEGPPIGLFSAYNYDADEFETVWLLIGDPASPVVEAFGPNDEPEEVLADHPADGTVYRFSPIMVANQNIDLDPGLKIYPTLTSGQLTLELPSERAGEYLSYEVIDLNGRLVQAQTFRAESLQEVNLNQLQTGMYFITIYENDRIIGREKLILQ
jgi:hypothetical protein